MFTAELKINGALIGVLYGHNEGTVDEYGRTLYTWAYYELSKTYVKSGEHYHYREDGLEKLISDILGKEE